MDKLIFSITDLPPMPRNRSHHIVNRMLVKTNLAREFEKDLSTRLKKFEQEFKQFSASFNPLEHYLKAIYVIYTPKSELFTKEGKISARSVDIDAHKLFQDVIFKSLGLDDKLIRDGNVITPASDNGKWNYIVSFQVKPLKELESLWTLETPSSLTSSLEEFPNLL